MVNGTTVCIVSYGTADIVANLILSMGETISPCDFSVWNNDSKETNSKVWDELRARGNVMVTHSQANIGFGAGVNRLIEMRYAAGTDHRILVLNPDVTISASALRALLEVSDSKPRSLVSPVLLQEGGMGKRVWFAGGEVSRLHGRVTHYRFGEEYTPESLVQPTSFISGAAFVTNVGTWQELGGFREDLFLYWEDAALSLRAVQKGVTMWVVRDALFTHAEGSSSRDGFAGRSPTFYYYWSRNRFLVCASTRLNARLGLIFGRGSREWLKQLAIIVLRDSNRRIRVRSLIIGTIHGLRQQAGPYVL